jgi:NAD(P)H-flavin reductase/ferredoxin
MTFNIRIVGADIAFACADGETVLDAAERAGYSIPYSCRKGVCLSCAGVLADGTALLRHQHVGGPRDGVLLCQAKPLSDLTIKPSRIEKRDPLARKQIKANVFRLHRPTSDVIIVQLRFPAGVRSKFRAGQYLRVILADGDSRNFSMANPPHESDGAELHVRRVSGGRFSEKVLATIAKGDKLDVEIPFGEFFLREDATKPIVLVATGTGFAPIKSMIQDMIKRGIRRPATLYWGSRSGADIYLPTLLATWQAHTDWLKIVSVLSEPGADWQGRRGLVHSAILRDLPDLSPCQVYACGNPLMINAARRDFTGVGGLPRDQFYADPFVPSADTTVDI